MIYKGLRVLCRMLFRFLFRVEVYGTENVPASGPAILCANHISNIDPPMVGAPLNRKVYYMAKQELFRIPVFRSFIRYLGAYPVKRGGVSKESIRRSLQLLDEGQIICIFPEGTRGNVGSGKKGAASLALKSRAPVIPVAIIGKYVPFRKMKIVFGPPLYLHRDFQPEHPNDLEAATEQIMREIYRLYHAHQ